MTIHLDPQRQKEAVVAGFLACEEALRDHVEAYVNVMAEWNPVAVCDDDKVIGVLTSKDNIVHLAIIPEYRGRWASRRSSWRSPITVTPCWARNSSSNRSREPQCSASSLP